MNTTYSTQGSYIIIATVTDSSVSLLTNLLILALYLFKTNKIYTAVYSIK